jgi:MOSC domain-containing protein YiiM
MDLSWRHDLWLGRLPSSPLDEGRVELLVLRPPGCPNERETPERVRLTEQGLEGDRWSVDPEAEDGTQVSLINAHLARAVVGDETRLPLTGDNLHVDLDLTEANLPVGTVLEVGDALLQVSEVPHRPCHKFHERFGVTNVKRVQRANRTGRRGRGVLCRVIQAGEVSVGDWIRVRR